MREIAGAIAAIETESENSPFFLASLFDLGDRCGRRQITTLLERTAEKSWW